MRGGQPRASTETAAGGGAPVVAERVGDVGGLLKLLHAALLVHVVQGLGLRDLHLHAVHVHRGDLLEARLGALERGGRRERGRVRAVAALLAPGEEVHRLDLVALGVRVVAQQPARSRAGRSILSV